MRGMIEGTDKGAWMVKLRFGIIGAANIALGKVMPALAASERCEMVAIASRDLKTAQEAATRFGIPNAYGSYEALLADENVDAVYIPLPNHLHKQWTLRAAAAGKHVLCEKPLALTASEAQEMADACTQAGVVLAEAFMYRHHPRYTRIKDVLASGEIGDVRSFHGAFTFNNAQDAGNVRYQRHMGGGSLYDVGCYPIHAARMLLGQEPLTAAAHALFSPGHDDVDMMAAGLLSFADGVAATFSCGMWAAFENRIAIVGTDGRIDVPSAFVYGSADEAAFTVTTRSGTRTETVPDVNQYVLQADAMAAAVLDGVPLAFPSADAVANMRVIDACLAAARTGQTVMV